MPGLRRGAHAALSPNCPRRARNARAVAGCAHRVVDFLAVGFRCGRRCRGRNRSGRERRGCGGRRRAGGCGWRRGTGRCHFRRFRFLPVRANLVGHERDGPRDLDVVEIRISTFRRHAADALGCVVDRGRLPFRDNFRPRRLVAELRRARDAGFVAVLADLIEHLLAASLSFGRAGLGDIDLADGPDARDDVDVAFLRAFLPARDELRQEDDQHDGHDEGHGDDGDELSGGFDPRFVLDAHWCSWSDGGIARSSAGEFCGVAACSGQRAKTGQPNI